MQFKIRFLNKIKRTNHKAARQTTKKGKGLGSLLRRYVSTRASLVAQWHTIHLPMQETQVWSLGQEDPLEKEMATHSSILGWRIPWTEEPCGLQSTGSQRVGHNWATSLSLSLREKAVCTNGNQRFPHPPAPALMTIFPQGSLTICISKGHPSSFHIRWRQE